MEAELRRRYGVDVPQQVRDILAVTKRAPYEEGLGWVETLVQRTKNTMFGLSVYTTLTFSTLLSPSSRLLAVPTNTCDTSEPAMTGESR